MPQTVSLGHLDGLIGLTYSYTLYGGAIESSYTQNGTNYSVSMIASGGQGDGGVAGEVYKIITVNDSTDAITYTVSEGGTVLMVGNQYVDAVAPNAMLVSGVTPSTVEDNLAGNGTIINQVIGVFSNQPIIAGTTTTFTTNGTYTANPACFVLGTRVATPDGTVAVEDLRVGDRIVTTRDGSIRPVCWIGQRRVDVARHPQRDAVAPIRIRRGAFGPATPMRDLLLSPDHAVFHDGVLIAAGSLVNGTSIVREKVASVLYFHVELDRHDVLLAEGLPCESYLETGNRNAFAGAMPMQLHPQFAPRIAAVAPLLGSGAQLDAIRHALAGIARDETLAAA